MTAGIMAHAHYCNLQRYQTNIDYHKEQKKKLQVNYDASTNLTLRRRIYTRITYHNDKIAHYSKKKADQLVRNVRN